MVDGGWGDLNLGYQLTVSERDFESELGKSFGIREREDLNRGN